MGKLNVWSANGGQRKLREGKDTKNKKKKNFHGASPIAVITAFQFMKLHASGVSAVYSIREKG